MTDYANQVDAALRKQGHTPKELNNWNEIASSYDAFPRGGMRDATQLSRTRSALLCLIITEQGDSVRDRFNACVSEMSAANFKNILPKVTDMIRDAELLSTETEL